MYVSVPLLFLHVKKFLSPSEGKHTNWPWHIERARNEEGMEVMVSRREGSKTKSREMNLLTQLYIQYSCDVQWYASESQVLFVQQTAQILLKMCSTRDILLSQRLWAQWEWKSIDPVQHHVHNPPVSALSLLLVYEEKFIPKSHGYMSQMTLEGRKTQFQG